MRFFVSFILLAFVVACAVASPVAENEEQAAQLLEIDDTQGHENVGDRAARQFGFPGFGYGGYRGGYGGYRGGYGGYRGGYGGYRGGYGGGYGGYRGGYGGYRGGFYG